DSAGTRSRSSCNVLPTSSRLPQRRFHKSACPAPHRTEARPVLASPSGTSHRRPYAALASPVQTALEVYRSPYVLLPGGRIVHIVSGCARSCPWIENAVVPSLSPPLSLYGFARPFAILSV